MRTIIGVSGKTCSGKTFLTNMLLETGKFTKLVTSTTRPPRVGEIPGQDYHFISFAKAKELVRAGQFIEHVEFNGNIYGLTQDELDKKLDCGCVPFIILTPDGQLKYQEIFQKIGNISFIKALISDTDEILLNRLDARLQRELARPGLNEADISKIVKQSEDRRGSILVVESDWEHQVEWNLIFKGVEPNRFMLMMKQFSNL